VFDKKEKKRSLENGTTPGGEGDCGGKNILSENLSILRPLTGKGIQGGVWSMGTLDNPAGRPSPGNDGISGKEAKGFRE